MRIVGEGLTVRLGGRTVLHGIDFTAEPGTVTALLGPNGSGKTTLMRAIAGLVRHAGALRFGGVAAGERHRVGYMAQDASQRPVLTALEVVLLGRLGRLGYRVADADLARAAAALEAVGMAEVAHRHLGEMSGGQRQLVQFAQVLVREPSAILLDEPTSALDLRHQLELLALVRRETRTRGTTTIVSVHDLNLALRFADRAIVLAEGRVAAAGVPADVLEPGMIARVYGVDTRFGRLEDGLATITAVAALSR